MAATRIGNNESSISTNSSNIGTNTSNIGTNSSNIVTNTSDIATKTLTKYKTDVLAFDLAGTGTILSFVNLTIGKTYKITANFSLLCTELPEFVGNFKQGATTVETFRYGAPNSNVGTAFVTTGTKYFLFVCSNTTVHVNVTGLTRCEIQGNGSLNETHALLEELPNHVFNGSF